MVILKQELLQVRMLTEIYGICLFGVLIIELDV